MAHVVAGALQAMTVSTQYEPITFKPGAVPAPEPVSWQFLDATQLRVTHISAATGAETVLVLGDDYAVGGNGRDGSGTVTPLAAWPVNDDWRIERVTALEQEYRIPQFEPLQSERLEQELDRQVLRAQEGARTVAALDERALKVPEGEVAGALPAQADRAGKFAVWDATGQNILPSAGTGGGDAALRTDLNSDAAGAAIVKFLQSGTSSSPQTVLEKLRRRRESADKTGATLNAQLDAWKTDLGLNTGGRIDIPSGSHAMTATFTAGNGYHLKGDGRLRTIVNPNFAGPAFALDAGIGSTAYHNRFEGIGWFTTDPNQHILYRVRNSANTEICWNSMSTSGIPGATSICVEWSGRELGYIHDNIWASAKPFRILPNTDPVAQNITTDYLNVKREHIISTIATEANFESTNAYISMLLLESCALVLGAEGVKLVNNTLAIASHNVSIMLCRKEQAQTASAFGFHFEFTAAVLQSLHVGCCYTASGQNGFYGRGVEKFFLHSTVLTQGAGRAAVDWILPNARSSLTLLENVGQVSGTKTIANAHPVIVVPSRVANNAIGSFEHHVYLAPVVDGGAGTTINFDQVPFIEFGGVQAASLLTIAPVGSRNLRMPCIPVNQGSGGRTDAILEARGNNGWIRVRYPKGGGAPVVEGTPSGIFAATPTANKIYPYLNGLISNSLVDPQPISVDVRQ